jgi:hypothetical protein
MTEVLLLFVWTRQDEWSDRLRRRATVYRDRVALRSVCADSAEARSVLANGKPRVEGVPVLIVTERSARGLKTDLTYDKEEIEVVFRTLGVSLDGEEGGVDVGRVGVGSVDAGMGSVDVGTGSVAYKDGVEGPSNAIQPLLGSDAVVPGTTGLQEIVPMFSRR